MNSSSSPHSDRRDEPTDERGAMEGASRGNERAWKDGQMEGKKGSRLVHKGRASVERRSCKEAGRKQQAGAHGVHLQPRPHTQLLLGSTSTTSPAGPLEEDIDTSQSAATTQPPLAQPAGPVSLVTSSLGVWTAAMGRFRLHILCPSELVWSDTLIHHGQEERRE